MNSLVKTFGIAGALVAIGVGLAACNNSSPYTPDPSELKSDPSKFSVELIQPGNFFSTLKDGLHKMTIDKEIAGTKDDLTCIVIKDKNGHRGYSAMSCNYDLANRQLSGPG